MLETASRAQVLLAQFPTIRTIEISEYYPPSSLFDFNNSVPILEKIGNFLKNYENYNVVRGGDYNCAEEMKFEKDTDAGDIECLVNSDQKLL